MTISGTVVDTSGTVVPGARISIQRHPDANGDIATANGSAEVTSNADGSFTVPNLAPGLYSVTVVVDAFTIVRRDDVSVSVGQTANLKIEVNPTLPNNLTLPADRWRDKSKTYKNLSKTSTRRRANLTN